MKANKHFRCIAKNKFNNEQCKLNTKKSQFCWIHAQNQGIKLNNNLTFKYRIKKSNIDNAGYGLFLSEKSEPIPKNTNLYIYSGDKTTMKKLDEKYGKDELAEYAYCNYKKNNRFCIDGDSNFNLPGKYANDCVNSNYECNVEFTEKPYKKININNHSFNTVPLRTRKTIKPGDEIFTSYGENYWEK
jgi:hypothetical protein